MLFSWCLMLCLGVLFTTSGMMLSAVSIFSFDWMERVDGDQKVTENLWKYCVLNTTSGQSRCSGINDGNWKRNIWRWYDKRRFLFFTDMIINDLKILAMFTFPLYIATVFSIAFAMFVSRPDYMFVGIFSNFLECMFLSYRW